MASLKTTIVNGTLTVNSSINVNDSSLNWLNGFTYPSIRINDATNNTGYHPWLSQKIHLLIKCIVLELMLIL